MNPNFSPDVVVTVDWIVYKVCEEANDLFLPSKSVETIALETLNRRRKLMDTDSDLNYEPSAKRRRRRMRSRDRCISDFQFVFNISGPVTLITGDGQPPRSE